MPDQKHLLRIGAEPRNVFLRPLDDAAHVSSGGRPGCNWGEPVVRVDRKYALPSEPGGHVGVVGFVAADIGSAMQENYDGNTRMNSLRVVDVESVCGIAAICLIFHHD